MKCKVQTQLSAKQLSLGGHVIIDTKLSLWKTGTFCRAV